MTGQDGRSYDPDACRIGVRAGHSIVRVTVWHPHWGPATTAALRAGLFGATGTTGDAVPDLAVARRLLEDALGTEAVATWIGAIEVADHSPEHAVSMADLRGLIERMVTSAKDPDGNPAHTELRMEVDGADAVVRTIVPLAPTVAPGRDRHVAVALHIDPFRATELTGAQVRSTVFALEDALVATVRENRAGLLVAVVHQDGSGSGEPGAGLDGVGRQDVVTLHFYLGAAGAADGGSGASGGAAGSGVGADLDHVINTLRATVSAWELGEASLDDEADPTWSAVQRYRV
ncbi:hypothetical protein [Corynebacterium terpenotabidum]|uniref:hypothetical protein n=1 Tax=Corynebacterium terpenotabidum TaxID=89154 RepID=UPI0012EDEDC9|nr:hypothetical protein [Corynebacterium terpenotabidum]